MRYRLVTQTRGALAQVYEHVTLSDALQLVDESFRSKADQAAMCWAAVIPEREVRRAASRGGRPGSMSTAQLALARQLLAAPDATVSGVARALGVSRQALHRALPDEIRALSGR